MPPSRALLQTKAVQGDRLDVDTQVVAGGVESLATCRGRQAIAPRVPGDLDLRHHEQQLFRTL